jgi:hypothetical protein
MHPPPVFFAIFESTLRTCDPQLLYVFYQIVLLVIFAYFTRFICWLLVRPLADLLLRILADIIIYTNTTHDTLILLMIHEYFS